MTYRLWNASRKIPAGYLPMLINPPSAGIWDWSTGTCYLVPCTLYQVPYRKSSSTFLADYLLPVFWPVRNPDMGVGLYEYFFDTHALDWRTEVYRPVHTYICIDFIHYRVLPSYLVLVPSCEHTGIYGTVYEIGYGTENELSFTQIFTVINQWNIPASSLIQCYFYCILSFPHTMIRSSASLTADDVCIPCVGAWSVYFVQ